MKMFVSKNQKLNEKELVVLCILNGLYTNKHDYLYISIEQIFYFLFGRFCNARKDKTILHGLKNGMESLAARGLIDVLDSNNDSYVLSLDGLEVNTDGYFVIVEHQEIQKIFRESARPFLLFEFFVDLVGTINSNTKCYYMSQDSMVHCFGRSRSKTTINDYLRQLEKLELIYIYRPNKIRNNGTYRNINNVYGRYRDKQAIINSALSYQDTLSTIACSRYVIDRRSIRARYNHFVSGSAKYEDLDEVKELFLDCLHYNDTLNNNADITPIDLSVFKNIDGIRDIADDSLLDLDDLFDDDEEL